MVFETVYAIHTFEAENDDEIPFQEGEPIVILEKDDLYGDSWWKGRNIHGQTGLFPMTYISYDKPLHISTPSLSTNNTSNDSSRESQRAATPTMNLNLHEPDLDTPLHSFRMPSPSIDETIDDIQDKLQRMAVKTEDERLYQNQLNQHPNWIPKNRHSSKLFMTSSSGSSSSSSRISSIGKQQDSPRSPYETIGNTKRIETSMPTSNGSPLITTNGRQINGNYSHPVTWDVGQVCMWLRAKGFELEEQRFIENDITGDVLVKLTVSTLMKELNINSFGKRVHIMKAINELKSQFSFSNENDDNDVSDLEEYQTQHTMLYESFPNQSMMNLNNYGTMASHINDARVNSNYLKNYPPTYYTHSQRVDDAEGANIEMVYPKVSNKKDKLFAKFNLKRNTNPPSPKKKDKTRTNSGGVWDLSKERESFVGSQLGLPKRTMDPRNTNYFLENTDDIGNLNEEMLKFIGTPDHEGWLLKKQGDKYKSWKSRYCILKGVNLYYFKNDKGTESSCVKGYVNLSGYRIIPDENILHGKYGFKLIHDMRGSHYFAHDDLENLKGWMKSMMKATIERDNNAPVISSSNIPTVPLSEARKLTPRPPDQRRPLINPAILNKINSPIMRPNSPLGQRPGSPVPNRPLSPALQTIHNPSSPLMGPYINNNRATMGFI